MVSLKPKTLKIPQQVTVTVEESRVRIVGPKGELSHPLDKHTSVRVQDGEIIIETKVADKNSKARNGLTQALLRNALVGVTMGFTKTLELSGVGYRAQLSEDELILSLGFSHPVKFKVFEGIHFSVSENKITVSGIDKRLVGQIAHNIRSVRPPEPYKGKGIRYLGEKIRRKAGKAAAKTVGTK